MLCSQGHEHVLVLVIVPPSVNPEICWQIPSAESAALALGEGPYLVVVRRSPGITHAAWF